MEFTAVLADVARIIAPFVLPVLLVCGLCVLFPNLPRELLKF